MSIFTRMAGGMFSQRVGRRLGRVIPNPFMRYTVMLAATSLAPRVYRGIRGKVQARRAARLSGAGPVTAPVGNTEHLRTW